MLRTRSLKIILIMCLVLVLVYLTVNLNNLNKTQTRILQQLDAARSTLNLLPVPPADAKTRLEEASNEYQKALADVSQKALPTDVIKSLLELTDSYNFGVNPVTTEQSLRRSIGGSVYRVLPVSLSLEGRMTDIVQFIASLEDEKLFPALEIESVHLTPLTAAGISGPNDTVLQIRISIIERLTEGG